MKSTGILRPVDKMGRVVIPKEIRRQLKVEKDTDKFEIFVEDDCIILRKFQPTCVFCGHIADSVEYGGYCVCRECIDRLYAMRDQAE